MKPKKKKQKENEQLPDIKTDYEQFKESHAKLVQTYQ